jgi:4-amino-4-deoxy-L-arabinose transferase-like glycosyltransferase
VEYESKLPITALNMIPRAVEQLIHPDLSRNWPESQIDIIRGRYISLLFLVLLGLLIFSWSKRLYNEKTAFVILLTYLLCPNFLTYGIFVSSDIFACFFMTAALYCLWLFFREQKLKYFVLMSLATGLAEISKFSMFHLFLLLPVLFATQVLYQRRTNPANGFSLRKLAGYTSLFLFINWMIICSSHLFYQLFVPISQYTFQSNGFKGLQEIFNSIIPGLPVPLPSSYISSMDLVMYFDQLGGGVEGSLNGAPYILGKHSVHGFWYYYLVAMFYKVPVSLLLVWGSAFVLFFSRFSKKAFSQNEFFLLLPVLYCLFYMNGFYSTQVGIRHLLIIFPLLFIFSGNIITFLLEGKRQWILYALLAFQAISVLRYFPHFLPYTNEFITDKKLAYKKIADTNLCYAEGQKFLKAYLATHPDAIYMPDKPVAGKVVFEVNEMLNLNIATVHKYDWARDLVPVDHIHSQYLVFNVTKQMADSLQKQRR